MHIIATPQEFDAVKEFDGWPEGTTVVTCEDREFFFNYQRVDGSWTVTHDHKDHDRDWKRGEKKKFLATLTREKVIEIFLRGEDDSDNRPPREYQVLCDYSQDIFKHIPLVFFSAYHADEDEDVDLPLYVMPTLVLNRSANTAEVVAEIEECLEVMRRLHPRKKVHQLDVLDHECSQYNSWYFNVYPDGTVARGDARYGRGEGGPTFKNLTDMVAFAKAMHYSDDD